MVGEPPSPIVALAPTIPGDVFTTLNDPAAAHAELCDPGGDPTFPDHADRITNRFCQDAKPGGVVPHPDGLAEFLHVLDLDFATPGGGNGTDGNPAFAILGHSSALTARKVSSITPTAFVFSPLERRRHAAARLHLPRVRSRRVVPRGRVVLPRRHGRELLSRAVRQGVHARPAAAPTICSRRTRSPAGATSASTSRRPRSNNTIADCRQCHIGTGRDVPDGGDPLILRMQEIEAPHTHWFSSRRPAARRCSPTSTPRTARPRTTAASPRR